MRITSLVLGTVLLVGTASTNASVIIDDFSTGQQTITATVGDTVFSSVEGLGILGGERDIVLTNFDALTTSREASIEVADGMFNLGSDSTVEAEFQIQWDGLDGTDTINTNGLGGIDLTEFNIQQFVTTIVFSDFDSFFDVTFWWNEGTESETVALSTPGHNDLTTPREASFSINEFDFVDFTDIGAIRVRGNIIAPTGPNEGERVSSYDLSIDNVAAVPEPTSVALMSLMFGGLAFARRKKTL